MKYKLGFDTWSKEEESSIKKVVSSGNYTMGSNVEKFEMKFSKYFGSKYATMVNSGSSANLIMMSVLKYFPEFLKIKTKNPNIIVPAIGWSTSYFPISQCGFKLNFVDVDENTLNIDTKKVEKAIDKNTVGILAINLLGNPCNFLDLQNICNKKKLILLEDNCESLGSKFKNKYSSTIGLMGSNSFFFSHHLQTMEGGIILTNSKKINEITKSLRAHGWVRNLPFKNTLYKKKGDNFKDQFTFILPGYALRPLEFQGAIGMIQLKKFSKFLNIRKKNAKLFKKLFSNQKWCSIQKEEGKSISSWYGFNLLLKGKLKNKRDKIIKKLISKNIEVRPTMTGNFLKNPVIKYLNHKISGKLTNSNYIDKNGFFFGNYPKNLDNELKRVYSIILEEYKK